MPSLDNHIDSSVFILWLYVVLCDRYDNVLIIAALYKGI